MTERKSHRRSEQREVEDRSSGSSSLVREARRLVALVEATTLGIVTAEDPKVDMKP